MDNKVSVDPERLEDLANEFVLYLSKIEEEYKNLHMELVNLINSAPAEYRHCFYQVGDPWGTGNQLVDLLSEMEVDLRMTATKFSDADNLVGQLFKLYEKYGAITAMGALVSKQLVFYGLGFTKFIKNSDDVYMYKHMSALNKLKDTVDNSKFRNLARAYLNPTFLLKKYNDVPFSDLVNKKVAKYLPEDVVKYTDNSKALLEGIKYRSLDTKTFKSFLQTGTKFAKTNVVSVALLTGIMETGGMGLKVSENYIKYGSSPEVLKRENAKAVGNAMNNTVAISAGSITGAFVGGAVGSLFGPVGTVVGAAAGSFVGGLVGEQAAKLTAGFTEKVAIKFKEPIHDGLELIKGTFETSGKLFEGVNKSVELVNNQIKDSITEPLEKMREVREGLSKAKDTADNLFDGAKGFLENKLSFH